MTSRNTFLWPVGSNLNFYKRRNHLIVSYKDRWLDLADTLMLRWWKASRTVYFGISRKGKTAAGGSWSEEQVGRIEERIRFDLKSDGYSVTVSRLSPLEELPLEKEFLWKLLIRVR